MSRIRCVAMTLAVLAGMGLAGAGAVVGLGLYNVSAHAGHLPGVSWILHTTFRQSVKLRAPAPEEVPPLDDPDLIALGAGHFASACAQCHTPPDAPRPATIRAMVPEPPPVVEAIADWQPQHLHWIVENGVKMSGMPGWPVESDGHGHGRADEVWAVVAYLEAVRRGTGPELPPAHLAASDPLAYCTSCHGPVGGVVPRLDIQTPGYLEAQLDAYATGARPSGIMAQAASAVPRSAYADLATALAGRDDPPSPPAADPDLISKGEALAQRGTRDVPACAACHMAGPDGVRKGPALAGQHSQFLAGQLKLWRDEVLTQNRAMHLATEHLEDAEIDALAAYFASLSPDGSGN